MSAKNSSEAYNLSKVLKPAKVFKIEEIVTSFAVVPK
jgi:hypothetical protein